MLQKAIKFGNEDAVELLLKYGVELDHPEGITHTPWFYARHNPVLSDKILTTEGAVRLTLTPQEKAAVDELIYSEHVDRMANMHKLDTPELLHAFALNFNRDDDWILYTRLSIIKNARKLRPIYALI